jgi:hypothetical protein
LSSKPPTSEKRRRIKAKSVFAVQSLWLLSKLIGVAVSLLLHTVLGLILTSFSVNVAIQPWCTAGGILIIVLIDRLLLAPFQLGFYAFWYDVAKEETPRVATCFDAYRKRRYRLSLRYAAFSLCGRIVLIVLYTAPAAALLSLGDVLWEAAGGAPLAALGCRLAGWLLLAAGSFLAAWHLTRFSLTVFFLPESGKVLWAARRSLAATKGKSGEILWLYIRYFVAFLLCWLLIPLWYILPRFYLSLAKKAKK